MTRSRWWWLLAATAVASAGLTRLAAEVFSEEAPVEGAVAARMRSAVLPEEREYLVHLPEGYETSGARRYPVLYVLDGGSQSAHTAQSAALLARIGEIPPVIVIGVPSIDGDTRNRDYTPPDMRLDTDAPHGPTGAADRFLLHLRSELIPRIERDYRTARPRMLAGWSRGGMFVLYSQIAAPAFFDARFAHSPFIWSDEDDRAVTRFEQGLSATAAAPSFLYLSLGDQETQTMQPFRRAVRVLETSAPQTLRWRADVSAGGDHGSNPRLSAPVGLCAMFKVGGGRSFD